MRDLISLASFSGDVASMCIALLVWIGATIGLLHAATRNERSLWEIRKGRSTRRHGRA